MVVLLHQIQAQSLALLHLTVAAAAVLTVSRLSDWTDWLAVEKRNWLTYAAVAAE
jgi:hypothetical protein